VIEIDLPASRGPYARAEIARELGRWNRELRVGAADVHAKAAGRFLWRQLRLDGRGHALEVRRHAGRHRVVRDAEDTRQPVAHLRQRIVLAKDDLDAPDRRPDFLDVQSGERAVKVPDQTPDEPRAVLALERDLRVLDEDGNHRASEPGDAGELITSPAAR
jgi:hypothetical protein